MLTQTAAAQSRTIISSHGNTDVWEDPSNGQRSLHAATTIDAGACIAEFHAAAIMHTPSYLTVQKDDDEHIHLSPAYLQYVNHSCAPNAFFDTTYMSLIALKAIAPGEEITFFYPSSEWDMAQSFACRCGSEQCLGEIKGAAHLPAAVLIRYHLTDYINRKIQENCSERR
jgi:hypothetical protein